MNDRLKIAMGLMLFAVASFVIFEYGPQDMSELPAENAAMPYSPDDSPVEDPEHFRRWERKLLAIDGVLGVGFGQDETGGNAIIVYLRDQSVSKRIPEELDEYPIVIEITGEIDAY